MSTATRVAYDTVAAEYEKQLVGELAGKPLDRGLLAGFAEIARLVREPGVAGAPTASPGASAGTAVEYPSRRCYLIARRAAD